MKIKELNKEQLLINIRCATINDSKSINSLSAHLGYKITSDNIATKRLEYLLESLNDNIWVLEKSNIIVGWIHVFTAHRVASPSFNEIGGLVVDPKERNQGMGRKLVEFVVAESKSRHLEWRVRCNAQREESHLFYEKIGFIKSKTQHVFTIIPNSI